jgi:GT2 family glycosyltransferase/SAM-dependent methyltransferase
LLHEAFLHRGGLSARGAPAVKSVVTGADTTAMPDQALVSSAHDVEHDVEDVERAAPEAHPTVAPYYLFERPEVVAAVPEDARRVLELGCAAGRAGAALKHRQECVVVGVELDPEAAALAAEVLDEVIVGDLDELELDFPPASFDAAICADVLEHLVDPWRVLERLGELVRSGGTLVASIPNVRSLPVLAGLAEGRFEYAPSGVLDDTHVRFFTRRRFEEMLLDAGFAVERVATIHDAPIPEEFRSGQKERRTVSAGRLSLKAVEGDEALELHASQLLFVARRYEGAPGSLRAKRRTGGLVVGVVVRDEAPRLRTMLDTLGGAVGRPYRLVIVDDASVDDVAKLASSPDGAVVVVHRDRPRGKGAGWNAIVEETAGEFVALVDAGVALEPGAIDRLLEALEADDHLGAACSAVVGPNGALWSAGTMIERIEGGLRSTLRRAGDDPRNLGDVAVPVDGLAEGLVVLRRSAFVAAGGADEGFVDGPELIDLSLRIRDAGFALACHEGSRVRLHAPSRRAGGRRAEAHARRLAARWGGRLASLEARTAARAPERGELIDAAALAVPSRSGRVLVVGAPDQSARLAAWCAGRAERVEAVELSPGCIGPEPLGGLVGPFDAIVLARALEWARRPEALLERVRDLAAKDATVVVAAANVASLPVLVALIEGRWLPEEDALDGRASASASSAATRLPVRFLTRRGLVRLLSSSGLSVATVRRVPDPRAKEVSELASRLADDMVTSVARGRVVISGLVRPEVDDLASAGFVVVAHPVDATVGASSEEAPGAAEGVGRDLGVVGLAASLDATLVVPVADDAEGLARFVAALAVGQPQVAFELVIADRGSLDATAGLRDSPEGHIAVVHLPRGVGAAAAKNAAARRAKGRHLVFVEPGVAPEPGWLEALVATLDEGSLYGAAVPCVLGSDGRVLHAGLERCREASFGAGDAEGARGAAGEGDAEPVGDPEPALQQEGSVLRARLRGRHLEDPAVLERCELEAGGPPMVAVRRQAFEDIGGFDEHLVAGDEDIDLCLRLRERRWHIAYVPSAVVRVGKDQAPRALRAARERSRRLITERHGIRLEA